MLPNLITQIMMFANLDWQHVYAVYYVDFLREDVSVYSKVTGRRDRGPRLYRHGVIRMPIDMNGTL